MSTRTSLMLCALAALGLVAVQPVRASLISWDEGGGDKSWNTATNWSDDTLPSGANEYILDDSLVAMTASYGLDADFTIQTLTLNSAAMTDLNADTSSTTARTLTLNGGTGNPLIKVGTSANAAVNIGVAAGVGTLGITLAGSGDIDVASGKTLTIASAIGESGSQSLTKTGGGTLVLSGANNYTGTTTVNAGLLKAGSTTAFGPAANAGLAFGPGSTGTVQLNGNSMTVIGLNTDSGSPGMTYVQNGSATAATLTINNAAANTFAGVFQKGSTGNLALTKTGAGKLTLTGNSGAASIGGVVQVNAGSMEISGGGFLYSGANSTSSIGTGASDSNVTVTIIGTGSPASSTWRNNGSIRVGLGGDNNTLTVSNGGKIWAGGGTDNISIGYNNGSDNNTLTVKGSGSSLVAEDYLEVGRGGAGNTLNVEQGATASCYLFWSSGGTGNPSTSSSSTVKVDGAGSQFTVTGSWDIADRGTGNQFKVLNGGTANMTGGGYVGYYTGNVTVLIDGAGSVWNTSGVDWANTGNNATGTVSNGGRWNSNDITFKNANNLNLDGGVNGPGELNVQTLNLAAAGGRLNFNGGRLIAKSTGSLLGGSGQINLIGPGYIKTDYARTISNAIYGGGSLIKEGIGVLTLSGAKTYSGATTISAGTLKLGATGAIAGSPTITVASSAYFDTSAYATWALASGQTITGTGTIAGPMTVAAGSVLSPGNSPGTLSETGNQAWAGGGKYTWELNRVDTSQKDQSTLKGIDPGFDFMNITGALAVTATSDNRYIIAITGLDLSNAAGQVNNWNKNKEYEWIIATASAGVTPTESFGDLFTLDTTAFTNFNEIDTRPGKGFSIKTDGNNVVLEYIPEPATLAFVALGGLGLLLRRRRPVRTRTGRV